MQKYIFGEKGGIYIINLELTLECLKRGLEFLKKTASEGKQVLFVGTKKQAQEAIRTSAQSCGMPYVHERWLGGMLTNFETVRKSVARLDWIDQMEHEGNFKFITKKEVAHLLKEREKLTRYLTGIRQMKELPAAVFIVDTKQEEIGLREALKLEIPTVALIDTNCDPEPVDYPIPGNDDAIRAIKLFCDLAVEAIKEGQQEFFSLYPEAEKEAEKKPEAPVQEKEQEKEAEAKPVQAEPAEAAPPSEAEKEPEPAEETLAARFEREKLEAELKLKGKRPGRAKEPKKSK